MYVSVIKAGLIKYGEGLKFSLQPKKRAVAMEAIR